MNLTPADVDWARSTFWKIDNNDNGTVDREEGRDFVAAFYDRFLSTKVRKSRYSVMPNKLTQEDLKEFEDKDLVWEQLRDKITQSKEIEGTDDQTFKKANDLWAESTIQNLK